MDPTVPVCTYLWDQVIPTLRFLDYLIITKYRIENNVWKWNEDTYSKADQTTLLYLFVPTFCISLYLP